MLVKVIEARYVQNFQLELTFNDGITKIVDLNKSLTGSIFEPLKDLKIFRKFKLNRWTIEWENGADFAPEYLHDLAIQGNKASEKQIL